jgi:hypothetical protein
VNWRFDLVNKREVGFSPRETFSPARPQAEACPASVTRRAALEPIFVSLPERKGLARDERVAEAGRAVRPRNPNLLCKSFKRLSKYFRNQKSMHRKRPIAH